MFAGLVLAGRYELIEKLGSGGMGSVWRARDQTLNAQIAIKLLASQFLESDIALSRFRREAQAAALIRSTYVVQIFDHGVDDGTPFIAMELLKGESLAQRLQRERTLNPALTSRILVQVARALALAHSSGIVHRDMKPDNVFLVDEDEEPLAKVLDFGVARHHTDLAESTGLSTRTGAILGTPFYMSPEQATGQTVDHRADIWSYGVIACECLTGRRAFKGDSIGALFHAICMAEMPVPSQLNAVPAGFDAWFARAVARDKTARFQSIKEAAEELRVVCGGMSVHSAPPASALEVGEALAGTPQPSVDVPVSLTTDMREQAHTGDPSSISVSNLVTTRKKSFSAYFIVAAALVVGVLLLGWRWLTTPSASAPTATASSARSAATQKVPSAPSIANETPAISPKASAPHVPIELGETIPQGKSSKALRARPKAPAAPKPATAASNKAQPGTRGPDDNAAGI